MEHQAHPPILRVIWTTLRQDPATAAHLPATASDHVLLDDAADLAPGLAAPTRIRRSSRASAPTADEPRWADVLPPLAADAPARVVLWSLPKSVREVEYIAARVAAAGPAVLIAGGRVKHMTPAMSTALARHFGHVHATLARQKSRCLVAARPRPGEIPRFRSRVHAAGIDLTLCGVGGVFHGADADHGSLLLLDALADAGPATPASIHDLGCGNGLLTAWLARRYRGATVSASDDALDAVDSTRLTLAASGVTGVEVRWEASLASVRSPTHDLIVLNPPFHRGAGVDTAVGHDLIAAAARALRPGGELWVVHNSHLRYRRHLERHGRVDQLRRDPRFTVLRMTRGHHL